MRYFLISFLLGLSLAAFSQDTKTIRVKKESNLAKAVLDNTEGKLMVVDRFGNPKENQIVNYRLYIKSKKETKEFSGHSNQLTGEMLSYLNKQKSSVKIFFTEISAKDDDEHLVKLPDVIETWFPECKRCP